MKTQFFKILFCAVAIVVSANSCSQHGNDLKLTSFGYEIYSLTTHTVVDNYVGSLDLALKVNLWLNASTDTKKYEIEDRFFKHSTVRKFENRVEISNVGTVRFNTRNIYENDAKWSVERVNLEGTCYVERDIQGWKVTSQKQELNSFSREIVTTVNLNIRAEELIDYLKMSDISLYLYSVTGRGNYYEVRNHDYTEVYFTIGKEMACIQWDSNDWFSPNPFFHFFDGEMDMTVLLNPGNISEKISASLEKSTHHQEIVEISYNGYKEIW